MRNKKRSILKTQANLPEPDPIVVAQPKETPKPMTEKPKVSRRETIKSKYSIGKNNKSSEKKQQVSFALNVDLGENSSEYSSWSDTKKKGFVKMAQKRVFQQINRSIISKELGKVYNLTKPSETTIRLRFSRVVELVDLNQFESHQDPFAETQSHSYLAKLSQRVADAEFEKLCSEIFK